MRFPAFEPIDIKNNISPFLIEELFLSKIVPDPNQPRKKIQDDTLEELALSIKHYGVIQPIIVKKMDHDSFQIIAGERRWRASQIAGLKVIPAIIKSDKEEENFAISLIENIQREELNPIELAQAYRQLSQTYELSHEAIANMVGKSRASISNFLRLLNLSKETQDLIIDGQLEMGHARALLTLSSEQQLDFSKRIVQQQLSVREVEKLVQNCKKIKEQKPQAYEKEIDIWTEKLSQALSSDVLVKIDEEGKGRLIINFNSIKEINWIVDCFTEK